MRLGVRDARSGAGTPPPPLFALFGGFYSPVVHRNSTARMRLAYCRERVSCLRGHAITCNVASPIVHRFSSDDKVDQANRKING